MEEAVKLCLSIIGPTQNKPNTLFSVHVNESFSIINLNKFNQIYEKKKKTDKTPHYFFVEVSICSRVELKNHDWNTHYQVLNQVDTWGQTQQPVHQVMLL